MMRFFSSALILLALALTSGVAVAQVAHSFSAGNLSYSQDFDGMTATGTTYPTGWNGARVGGSGTAGQALNPAVTDGSANSGAVYNVGTTGATDRALGTLASVSTVPAFGASFSNNTAGLINSFTINAFHEQWRSGSSATTNEVVFFEYSFNATGIHDPAATWDSIPSLNLNEILTATTTAAAVNGNDPANRVAITGTATGLSWAAGTTLWIRWRDFDHPANDGIYAVDDFNMTVTTGGGTTPSTSIITYRVDITGLNAPNGVNIAGSFNGWNATANPMTQVGTTNVYEFVDTVNINDTIAYKFIIAGTPATWEELNGPCNIGGNRQVIATAPTISLPAVAMSRCNVYGSLVDITLRINMDSVATISPNGVHVAGNFQRPNHWQPGMNQASVQTGNIYAFTFKADPNTNYQYKFLNGNSWGTDESVPAACAVGGNREVQVGTTNATTTAFLFGTCNLAAPASPTLPLRTAASLKGVNANGVADSLNARVAVRGVVVSHNISVNGMQYVIYDGTGGITIFRSSGNFGLGQLSLGDSVWAQGTVTQFRGLTQLTMNPTNAATAIDTCVLVAVNRPLPAPLLVPTVNESTESELIRIDSLQIVSGTWPAAGSTLAANIIVRSANDTTNTFTLRVIANGTNLAGAAPTTPIFSVIGVGSQFTSSIAAPFVGGYQIFPRMASDIIPVQAIVQTQVTFQVDLDTLTVGAGGVRVVGNFNGWNPASPNAIMTRIGTSSIYERTATINAGNTIEYKFLRDSLWSAEETVPAACGVSNGMGGFNRSLVVPATAVTLPAVIFGTCSPATPTLTLRTIASIRGVDSLGVADSLNTLQRLTGTLHGLNHYRSSSTPVGLQWFMLDGTGGITIRRAGTTFGLTLNPGDSVIVEGTLTQFNGLLQMNVDTLIRVATGRTLQQPTVVTHPTEATENNYIRVNGLTIASGNWPAANANGFIQVTNGTQTFEMFIISILNNPQWTQPTGVFDLVGFGAQNDNSNPFTSGYQIIPMTNADIIPVAVTQPTLNFGRADTLVTNQVTSFPMFINILNPVNNAATVRVAVRTSAGVTYGATGNFNTAPAAVNDTIDLAVAANATFTGFSMQLNGNVPVGRTDTVTFTIVSATGGLNIGAISSSRVRITNPLPPPVTNLNIAQIRGNDTNGIADSIGVRVRTRGVVLGFNKRPAGLEFHIFDRSVNTGISVFRATGNLGYNVTEGDSVEVVGVVAHFNGLSQINVDSVTVRTTGNTIPAAAVVTALNEFSESRLVRINNLTLVDPTQWPVAGTTGTGRNVRVTNGVDSFEVRVVAATSLFGTPVPTGTFDVIGIGGQFFSTSPHTGGYQLIPRYLQDLVTGGASADSINNFALVSPANNSSLTIEGAQTTEINVRWNQASWTGGAASFTYTWLVDLPTGDFSTPLATLPANNSGADTVLTLSFGAIAALLDANGIPQGMSATLKWTVLATRTGSTDTKLATQPFTLTLTRGVMTSVAENALEGMKLYPNPASGRAYLTYSLPAASNLQLELINMIGKRVHVEVLHNTTGGVAELDLANLPEGVYFVRLSNEAYSATRRLVVKH